MNIGVIGVDLGKLSAVEMRRVVSMSTTHALFQQGAFEKVVVLSTCHRFEVFFSDSELTGQAINILHLIQEIFGLKGTFSLYSFFGYDCFFHLAKVACGLDSKIFGEDEILRQVKVSYERDKGYKKIDSQLHFLFQKCLKIGKDIRSKLGPRQKSAGIPASIISLIQEKWGSLKERRSILFLGNSMINRKIYGYFTYRTKFLMHIATLGSLDKKSLPLVARTNDLFAQNYDVIIAAGQSKGYLLSLVHKDMLLPSTLLIDLGAARNIDPAIDQYFRVYSLEEIEKRQEGSVKREEVMECILSVLTEHVKKYILIYEDKLRKKREKDYGQNSFVIEQSYV